MFWRLTCSSTMERSHRNADSALILRIAPAPLSICCLRLPAWLNNFPHCKHLYGCSSMCVAWCVFKLPFLLNDLLHLLQSCIFSPSWVSLWLERLPALENLFWHKLQVAIFTCLVSRTDNLCTYTVRKWVSPAIHCGQFSVYVQYCTGMIISKICCSISSLSEQLTINTGINAPSLKKLLLLDI